MALIKLSALVNKVSGKLGGSVIQNTNNGTVIKQNSFSVPQRSNSQVMVQSKIQLASLNWSNLPPGAQDSWSSAALGLPYNNAVGQESYLNGYQLFLKRNMTLIQSGQNPITYYSGTSIMSPPDVSFAFFWDCAAIWILGGWGGGTTANLYASNMYNSPDQIKRNTFKKIFSVVNPNQSLEVNPAYTSVYGAPIVGKFIGFYIQQIDNNNGSVGESENVTIIQVSPCGGGPIN